MSDRPEYQVPTMAEVEALPWNGRTVVSTFSGCGGSCLGYRMAGFKVAWASEFIEAAQETYRLNHPTSFLSTSDIRKVTAADILDQIGLEPGQVDVFDGSPPCASFSTSGKREKGWGTVKKYSDTEQRVDDLFFEYARILRGLQPKAFVAENVAGLVMGTAKGYFKEILKVLKSCGYRVSARVLDAQWLGVPQSRRRLIFVGFREDLGIDPVHPSPLPYRYSCTEAISSPYVQVIHDTSGQFGAGLVTDRPWPTITVGPRSINSRHYRVSGDEIEEDPETGEAIGIGRFAIGPEWEKLGPGESSDRYFNLVRPDPGKPSPYITQTGGSVGAASVTHPLYQRKFTLQELRRICAFSDDFRLTGTYAQRWERLGRAVPPVMMFHIAATVRDALDEAGA